MGRILALSLLIPSLFIPAAAKASTPVDHASAPTPVRVSTGVTLPVLLDSNNLSVPTSSSEGPLPSDAQVGLTLTVDENGRPQNVRVVKSLNPLWDARIVDAVRQFHYRPGTLSNQPVPVDLELTVNIAY